MHRSKQPIHSNISSARLSNVGGAPGVGVDGHPDLTLGTICIYEARDPASIKEHAQRVGMPADEINEVANTVVIRPDPKA